MSWPHGSPAIPNAKTNGIMISTPRMSTRNSTVGTSRPPIAPDDTRSLLSTGDPLVSLYSSLPPGTPVVAVGCTYSDPEGTTLNAGPPARTMGESWRARGYVSLEPGSDVPTFSDESIEVQGVWTGSSIRVEAWRERRTEIRTRPVGERPHADFSAQLAKSLSEFGEAEVLGHLTDAADTRNLITVALLTDKWKSWADQWRDTAFVQIQGFISPDGSERIYPEQPAL